jgi:hypothetical protein
MSLSGAQAASMVTDISHNLTCHVKTHSVDNWNLNQVQVLLLRRGLQVEEYLKKSAKKNA